MRERAIVAVIGTVALIYCQQFLMRTRKTIERKLKQMVDAEIIEILSKLKNVGLKNQIIV